MRKYEASAKINQVATTKNILTGRGGLALFVKYLNGVGVHALLDESFGKMRKSLKGQLIWKYKIVDAVFRGGKKHSNYGNTAVNMITDIVKLIRTHHLRGADELPHRGLKEFGSEELPFKRFAANRAFYYCMLISFFLFATYKEDVLRGIVPITAYATTVRRQVVDWAAKIVRGSGKIVLKVTQAVMSAWQVDTLWVRCQPARARPGNPPPIIA